MLADSREFIQSDPWIVALPGLAILITVIAINLTGDGLRDGAEGAGPRRPRRSLVRSRTKS